MDSTTDATAAATGTYNQHIVIEVGRRGHQMMPSIEIGSPNIPWSLSWITCVEGRNVTEESRASQFDGGVGMVGTYHQQ